MSENKEGTLEEAIDRFLADVRERMVKARSCSYSIDYGIDRQQIPGEPFPDFIRTGRDTIIIRINGGAH